MSLVTGPVPLVATTPAELKYPSDAPADYIVIDNVSPFLVKVGLGGTTHWLPPFTSNVWRAPGNHQPVTLLPSPVPGATDQTVVLAAPACVTATWYAPTEGVPGGVYPAALTGPAIEAGLASSGLVGSSDSLKVGSIAVTNGTVGTLIAKTPGKVYRLWNWGAESYAAAPAAGAVAVLQAFTTPATPNVLNPVDTVSIGSPASSRISGLLVERLQVHNTLGQNAAFFVLYSELTAP